MKISFQLVNDKLDNLTKEWKNQVISFIKEKDKLLNPDKYTDEQAPKRTKLNSIFFDDESDDDSVRDTDSDPPSNESSPIIGRRQPFPQETQILNNSPSITPDPAVEDSNIPKSNAEMREKMLDDEFVRYAQFSKDEFHQKLIDHGFTEDKSQFQPVGKFVWKYWQSIKHEFPIIYGAIQNILTAPTSSSAVERLFSKISAFVSRNSNAYKAKNLIVLIQISEIETFQEISAEICRQNGVELDVNAESHDSNDTDTPDFEQSTNDENFDIFEEQIN